MTSQVKAFETRAQQLGISPKTMVARARRTLASVRKQLLPLAAQWSEIDNSVEFAHQDLMVAFEEFEEQLQQTCEWLNEEPGT